ncbi:MAG: DMT family transporter [Clostridia bacterium]|nr:DMT family transporter [Clostridia bacterium]
MTKKSFFLLALTAIIWGFAFAFQRVGGGYLGNFSFNCIRYLFGTCALIPVIFLFEKGATDKKKTKTTWIYGAITGFILFAASALQQAGINITGSAGKSGFITGLYLVLVPFFGLFLGKKIRPITWIAAALAVGGLYLISFSGATAFGWGDGVLLLGTIFWAAHILIIDKAGDSVYSIRYSCVQFLVCALLNLVMIPFFESPTLADVRLALIPLLYSGIMSTGVAYTCQVLGQKNTDPALASLILSTETVFSAVGGALLLGERMTPGGYVGCILIFSAILICQVNRDMLRKLFRRG